MTTATFLVLVEDDNGRYFNITVEARSTSDARDCVHYILDHASARIVSVEQQSRL